MWLRIIEESRRLLPVVTWGREALCTGVTDVVSVLGAQQEQEARGLPGLGAASPLWDTRIPSSCVLTVPRPCAVSGRRIEQLQDVLCCGQAR